MSRTGLLILSNLLSASAGTRSVGEELIDHLAKPNRIIIAASKRKNRLLRLVDMLYTAWVYRHAYAVAYVEAYSGLAFIWAELSCQLLRWLDRPYILTLHGGKLPQFAKHYPNRVRRLLQSATAVTTPSHLLQENFLPIRGDILWLPNAIDLDAYTFRQRNHAEPKLAWLRAFHKIYNPVLAAQVIALLKSDYSEIQLTMFGPDKNDGTLSAMRDYATNAHVSQRIHVYGPIPKKEVPTLLGQHDIFLNTTTAESFGVSMVEAAALGMCIVTTDVGELPYIWTHEHDALLVPPNDPQAMAIAVRRLLTEPELAERLSGNARLKAEKFDWSAVLPQWENLLSTVIERHSNG